MAWKWIRISFESRMVSWYKNEMVRAGISNCMRQCLNFLILNVHIPAYLGKRASVFLLSVDRRLVQIRIYQFVLYKVTHVNLICKFVFLYDFVCMNLYV
jgi:hypothetical protein